MKKNKDKKTINFELSIDEYNEARLAKDKAGYSNWKEMIMEKVHDLD